MRAVEFDEMDVTIIVSDEDETPALSGPTAFEYAENAHYHGCNLPCG